MKKFFTKKKVIIISIVATLIVVGLIAEAFRYNNELTDIREERNAPVPERTSELKNISITDEDTSTTLTIDETERGIGFPENASKIYDGKSILLLKMTLKNEGDFVLDSQTIQIRLKDASNEDATTISRDVSGGDEILAKLSDEGYELMETTPLQPGETREGYRAYTISNNSISKVTLTYMRPEVRAAGEGSGARTVPRFTETVTLIGN